MRSNLRHSFGNTGLGWCWNTDNRVQSGVRVLRDVVLGSLEKLWNCGKKRTVDKIVDNEENVRDEDSVTNFGSQFYLAKWLGVPATSRILMGDGYFEQFFMPILKM